jgi:hypothetical protein
VRDFGRNLKVQWGEAEEIGDRGAEDTFSHRSATFLPRFCIVSVLKEGVGGITGYGELFGYRFSA